MTIEATSTTVDMDAPVPAALLPLTELPAAPLPPNPLDSPGTSESEPAWRARQKSFHNGRPLVECLCRVSRDEAGDLEYYAGYGDMRRMWIPHESCRCEGTGWLCFTCHNARWVKHGKRVDPCPECADVVGEAVMPQSWWAEFVRAMGGDAAREEPPE